MISPFAIEYQLRAIIDLIHQIRYCPFRMPGFSQARHAGTPPAIPTTQFQSASSTSKKYRSIWACSTGRSDTGIAVSAWLIRIEANLNLVASRPLLVVDEAARRSVIVVAVLVRPRTDEDPWRLLPDFAPLPASCRAALWPGPS